MNEDLEKKLDTIVRHLNSLDKYNSLTAKNLAKSFSLGIAGALGATIGLAVVISILGFFIKEFGALPGIGKWFIHLGSFLGK